jgi:ribosomal subunit interface protein
MTLRVSGKNIDIGESLRTYVGARIDLVVLKYAAEPTGGHVTIEREGSGFRTDCTLHLDSGITLQAEAEAQDAYSSFNKAADRIEKRLQRCKRRVKDRTGGSFEFIDTHRGERAAAEPAGADFEREDSGNPVVIAESLADLKEMSVSAAVEELDVSKAPVIVFRHAGDGRANIVYRRADGNIGWLDPTSMSKNPSR